MEENREIEIDLKKIFDMIKKKAIFIVIITLIGGVIAGCYTNFCVTPQYTATAKLYAWSDNDNVIGSSSSVTSSQVDAAETLVNTYLVAVESDTLLDKVADKLDNDMTAKDIRRMMSCSQINETIAFQISITSPNPKLSAQVVNAIADTCPDVIVKILKVGGVEIIDRAKEPTRPSSPSLKKNVLIGAMAGFIISFAFFFLQELLDTSIKDEEDLKKEFEIPVLGTVPKLVPSTDKSVRGQETMTSNNLTPPRPSINNENNKEVK